MGSFKGVMYAVARGMFDSVAGFYLIFTIADRSPVTSRIHQPHCQLSRSSQRKSANRQRDAAAAVIQCSCDNIRSLSRAASNSGSGSSGGDVSHSAPGVSALSLRQRVLECCMLNGGVLLTSMLVFQHVLLPVLHLCVHVLFGEKAAAVDRVSVWTTVSAVLTWTFSTLWLVPIFFISRIINCIWFQDIADEVYRRRQGRSSCPLSLSVLVADSLFSVFAQVLFLLQGTLSTYLIPIASVGWLVNMVHMCLLYSLYSFEYRWYHMGWEMHRRLMFLESEWPYFVGFGLPLALVTQAFSSYLMNGCVFSVLFPVFIVSGTEATPVTGLCETPLHLFSPVIMVSNAIFRRSIASNCRQ